MGVGSSTQEGGMCAGCCRSEGAERAINTQATMDNELFAVNLGEGEKDPLLLSSKTKMQLLGEVTEEEAMETFPEVLQVPLVMEHAATLSSDEIDRLFEAVTRSVKAMPTPGILAMVSGRSRTVDPGPGAAGGGGAGAGNVTFKEQVDVVGDRSRALSGGAGAGAGAGEEGVGPNGSQGDEATTTTQADGDAAGELGSSLVAASRSVNALDTEPGEQNLSAGGENTMEMTPDPLDDEDDVEDEDLDDDEMESKMPLLRPKSTLTARSTQMPVDPRLLLRGALPFVAHEMTRSYVSMQEGLLKYYPLYDGKDAFESQVAQAVVAAIRNYGMDPADAKTAALHTHFSTIMEAPEPTDEQLHDFKAAEMARLAQTDVYYQLAVAPAIWGVEPFDPMEEARNLKLQLVDAEEKDRSNKAKTMVLVDELPRYTADQRLAIAEVYTKVAPERGTLQSEVEGMRDSYGDAKRLLLDMLHPMHALDAYWLQDAIKKKKWRVMTEILCTRTKSQLYKAKLAYKELSDGNDLVDDLCKLNTDVDWQTMIKNLAGDKRKEYISEADIDQRAVEKDTQALARLLSTAIPQNVNRNRVVEIITGVGWKHLNAVAHAYHISAGFDLLDVLRSKLLGTAGEGTRAFVQCSRSISEYFAGKLRESMKGLGTDEETLSRIVLSRSEIDICAIGSSFANGAYGSGKTLLQWIADDTSGSYKKLLLALSHEDEWESDMVPLDRMVTKRMGQERDARPCVVDNMEVSISKEAHRLADMSRRPAPSRDHANDPLCAYMLSLMTKCSTRQRQMIAERLKKKGKLDLPEMITKRFPRGHAARAMVRLLQPAYVFYDYQLRRASKNRDVHTMLEIMCTLTNEQIKAIVRFHEAKKDGKASMDEMLKNGAAKYKTAGKLLCLLAKGQREGEEDQKLPFDPEAVTKDAEWILHKKRKLDGRDKTAFVELFATRSFAHIRELNELIQQRSKIPLVNIVSKAMGTGASPYAIQVTLQYAVSPPDFFANLLARSLDSVPANLSTVERVVISRAEIDLQDIRTRFIQGKHGAGFTLDRRIVEATEKDEMLRRILINLLTFSDGEKRTRSRGGSTGESESRRSVTATTQNQHQHQHQHQHNHVKNFKAPDLKQCTSVHEFEYTWEQLAQFLRELDDLKANRIWRRVDAENTGFIDVTVVRKVCAYAAVVALAADHHKEGKGVPNMDQEALNDSFTPFENWLQAERIVADDRMSREQMKTDLPDWLDRYSDIVGEP